MKTSKISGISIFALVMLITGAVNSIRNLPSTALFGSSLIFFFFIASVLFLIPAVLISAELASSSSEKSGIYHWTCEAFGKKTGFLAIWLQWISNLVWLPTILSFIAGTAAYFFSPALAQNKFYLVSMILGTLWVLTFINLKGLTVSVNFTSFCTIIGLAIPMPLIIVLALIWIVHGYPLQIHFTATNIIPKLTDTQNWISLTAIMTAFLGIELAAVHVKDVANPQKAYPKALFFSVLLILSTMVLGSLAIAFVLPKEQINLVSGALQAFNNFFAAYHILWIMPIITFLVIIGTVGGIVSFMISPARGLLQAAEHNYLPSFLKKTNQHGVASRLLILQAIIISLICLAFLVMPSINGSYWLLTALSTQMYVCMYIILFIVGLTMRYKYPDLNPSFSIPGGKIGLWIVCLLGLSGCILTEIVGFIPPDGINVGSLSHYEAIFISGMLLMILPVLGCYSYKNKKSGQAILPDLKMEDNAWERAS